MELLPDLISRCNRPDMILAGAGAGVVAEEEEEGAVEVEVEVEVDLPFSFLSSIMSADVDNIIDITNKAMAVYRDRLTHRVKFVSLVRSLSCL